MIRKLYILSSIILIVALLASLLFLILNQNTSHRFIQKNNVKLSNLYMESSPFVWNGQLKYFVAERDDKKKIYDLAIYDFATRKKEVTFGKGLGLGSAAVINNTLYVTATKDWFEFGKSEVYLMTSTDLRTFSKPKLILKAAGDQKIFNSDITYDTNAKKFVISYESQDSHSVPFTIYFLESKDGNKWEPVNDAIFGKDIYVACPTIKYLDKYYYLLFVKEEYYDPNCPKCKSYVAEIARSQDLKKWQTSPDQFLVADKNDEGDNNSDVDLTEYNGNTYLFYAIGDQNSWGGLKYAEYNGSMQELFSDYFN